MQQPNLQDGKKETLLNIYLKPTNDPLKYDFSLVFEDIKNINDVLRLQGQYVKINLVIK